MSATQSQNEPLIIDSGTCILALLAWVSTLQDVPRKSIQRLLAMRMVGTTYVERLGGYYAVILKEDDSVGIIIPTDTVSSLREELESQRDGVIEEWPGIACRTSRVRNQSQPDQRIILRLNPEKSSIVWFGGRDLPHITPAEIKAAYPMANVPITLHSPKQA